MHTPLTSAQQASDKVLAAYDFRYDKTNPPRYRDSVKSVASGISYPPGGRTDTYGTSAGIVTSGTFDSVVDWFRKDPPPGWHDMTIGGLGRTRKTAAPRKQSEYVRITQWWLNGRAPQWLT